MRNKVICLCFISLLFLGNVFCDTIILKSGKQVEGSIKERTNDAVKVDMEGVVITYYLMDIDSINGQKVIIESVTVTEKVSPQTTPVPAETYPGGKDESSGLQVPGDQEETIPETSAPSSFKVSPGLEKSTVPPGLAAGVVGGMILLVLFMGIIIYVYTSICLQFIAKKTGNEPLFLAWIPFAHHFLRFKIAKMNYLWIFVPVGVFFLSFIGGFSVSLFNALSGAGKAAVTANPIFMILNFFLTAIYAVFSGFLWYKISLARNKKSWIGALMAISILNAVPFVSFISLIGCGVIMGYLAFSE